MSGIAAASSTCKLCGLPTRAAEVELDGHSFCCFGCKEVYRCFGDIGIPDKNEFSAEVPVEELEGSEAYLRIDGMHCASCEYLIEKLGQKAQGIVSISCSFATSMAKIKYNPEIVAESELPNILSRSGYHAYLSNEDVPPSDGRMSLLRLIVAESLAATVMMIYLAFYYPAHLGLVTPEEMAPVAWMTFNVLPKVLFFLTSIMIFYVGLPIFRGAWIGLRTGILNMDNLLLLAILAAYAYSTGQMLMGSIDIYFDVAVAIVTVVTIGRYLEKQAKKRATRELTKIMAEWAPSARVVYEGNVNILSIEDLQPGDHIEIHAGEMVPVDGTVLYGQGAVDESLMTGEPFPVNRGLGEKILGGSKVVEGTLTIDVGNQVESQMDNLARILWNAQSATATHHGLADWVARFFVPVVLMLAILVTAGMIFSGSTLGEALLAGMATLIVSCPCTFGLAIPLTTAVGISTALRNGIIITRTDIFDKRLNIDTIAIDKTGTLSTAEMVISEIIGPPEVKQFAVAVERLSSHPIAQAIARLETTKTASDIEIYPGKGAVAVVDGHQVAVGSRSLFGLLGWVIPSQLQTSKPGVVSYVGWDGTIFGAIVTEDQPRPEWKKVVQQLRQKSRVVMLTGAEQIGAYEEYLDGSFAGIPPEGKAAVIHRLKHEGHVAMIGDGSNDAPALAAADLGIAFGAPTALAAEAAAIVIPGNQLDKVFNALNIIGTTRQRIRQNLGWALLYNATAIPLAVFGFLNPLFAALAMSTSSLLVVWNSSRAIDINKSQYVFSGRPELIRGASPK